MKQFYTITLALCIFPMLVFGNTPNSATSKKEVNRTESSAPKLKVSRGLVRAMPAVSTSTAAYLDIHNESEQNLTLIGAESNLGAVMIHTTAEHEGMVSMMHLDSVPLPAKQTVKLERGGMHLMVMGIKRMPKQGESVDFVLHFAEAPSLAIALKVE